MIKEEIQGVFSRTIYIYIYTYINNDKCTYIVVKNPLASAGDEGDTGDVGLIPGSGWYPGGGNDTPL